MTMLIFNENADWLADYEMSFPPHFSAHIGECPNVLDCTYDFNVGGFVDPLGPAISHWTFLTSSHEARFDYFPEFHTWATTFNFHDTQPVRLGTYREYIPLASVISDTHDNPAALIYTSAPRFDVPEVSAWLLLAMGLVALWNRLGNQRHKFFH